jgi:hypothetical protein
MAIKTIFLDIDGVLVLNEVGEPHAENAAPFDKECVAALNEILNETNAIIVLSSVWKKAWDLKRLDFIFKFNGVIKSPLDITDDFNNREKEITDYVQRKKITDFVILDSTELVLFPKQFIKCNAEEGLKQEGIKDRTIAILKKSLNPLQVS